MQRLNITLVRPWRVLTQHQAVQRNWLRQSILTFDRVLLSTEPHRCCIHCSGPHTLAGKFLTTATTGTMRQWRETRCMCRRRGAISEFPGCRSTRSTGKNTSGTRLFTRCTCLCANSYSLFRHIFVRDQWRETLSILTCHSVERVWAEDVSTMDQSLQS